MPTRSPGHTRATRPSQPRLQSFHSAVWLLLAVSLVFAGCGAPGEPTPPSPQIPVAITDLTAQQAGDAVELTFTPPGKSTLGERLKEPPTLEILKGGLKPDGSPDSQSFRVVDTIPGALVSTYQQKNKVVFEDPVPPEDVRKDAGKRVVYRVRARVSERKTSANSNEVTESLYPVPERISSLDVRMTENGVQLSWSPPTQTSGGEPLAKVEEYRVYRGELNPASAGSAVKDTRQRSWKAPLLQIAKSQSPEYVDGAMEDGKTYGYTVRSVVSAEGTLLESSDSDLKIITPKDIFPPAATQGLVAAVLPGERAGQVVVDLSWSINTEPDLAGYRVYRSEAEGSAGQMLTPELLPTPAYRDISVTAGKRYWYTITAVDRAGNESAPSAAIPVETTQPSP